MKSMVILISGASGAGKTTIAELLGSHYNEVGIAAVCIAEDSYFYGKQKEDENIDKPSAVNHDLLKEHLQNLKLGRSIEQPTYDHKTLSKRKETLTIHPKKIIIVEGLFIFSNPKLVSLADITIYIHAPEHICFSRRLRRDERDRALSSKINMEYYLKYVRTGFFKYTEPYSKIANLVVNNIEHEDARSCLNKIIALIDERLAKEKIQDHSNEKIIRANL